MEQSRTIGSRQRGVSPCCFSWLTGPACLSENVRPDCAGPNAEPFYNVQSQHTWLSSLYDYVIWRFNRASLGRLAVELRRICAGSVLEHRGTSATVTGRVHFVLLGAPDRLWGISVDSAQRLQDGQWARRVEH